MTTISSPRRSRFRGLVALAAIGLTAWLSNGAARAEEPDRFLGLIEPVVATKPLRFGVTVVHLQDNYWKGMAYGIVDEAKRAGVEVVQVSVAGAYGNVSQQFGQIQTMKTRGIDVLVLGPAAFDGYNAILTSLRKAGTMVIAGGIPVNSDQVDFGVVQDDYSIGAGLADFVCGRKEPGPAKALSIPGPAGAEWANLRAKGFREQAEKCDGLSVVEGPVGGAIDISYALGLASDMMEKNPDAKFFFTPEVTLGMGAIQAAKQRKMKIGVVSSTVSEHIFPALEDGSLLGQSTEPSILMGRLMVQYAIRKNEGLPMPDLKQPEGALYPALIVPEQILTKENVHDYPYYLTDIPPADWSISAFQ
ncbi:substrate-binding domain-containing protein [Zavarzinia compransoris]|uniref:substrate-binding domain-containing protein n=1 Tax=Zavarzinia marina TaxID=2911065 RepID=UPI001F39B3F6|nr:substrate-binding domain-containing protein [Zavarzinia marina]MCF4167359.1 substrate-binding domain-containing protein [Zavarzinia marina]